MFDPAAHQPPVVAGYRLIERDQIPMRRVGLIGLISAPVWIAVFLGLAHLFGGSPHIKLYVTFFGALFAIVNLTLVMPAAHEAVHGVVALLFRARPEFGIGPGFAYTTFREPVRLLPYLIIGLAPLVLISAAGVALLTLAPRAPGQTLIFIVGNATGAFGDLWVAMKVLRLPRNVRICDLADGFAYYLPEQADELKHPRDNSIQ